MAKELTPCQRRCQECADLKICGNCWTCEECFGQNIEEIDDCPNGVTLELLEEINKNAKENAPKNIARSDKKAERKPRERKPDIEKEQIISETAKFLQGLVENVKITNVSKIIEFTIGENHYKFDLTRQRAAKK